MAANNRTEKATPRRRQRALEQGNLLRSREVSAALVFAGCFILFAFLGSSIVSRAQEVFMAVLTYALSTDVTPSNMPGYTWLCGMAMAKLAWPFMGLAFTLGLAGSLLQHGFHWSMDPLTPTFNKLSPVANLSRMFSIQGLSDLVRSFLIFGVIAYLAWSVVQTEMFRIPSLVLVPVPQIVLFFGSLLYRIGLRVAIFMVLIALADYLIQKYRYEESLKMTKQEVKDEMKEMEGNPMVKGKIRRTGRDLLRRRMMSEVPKADVVITNPTEVAVAVRYDMERMAAPMVVAKGRGYVAARIRALAVTHKIPIVENPPLARALFKMVEVGQEIPAKLYKAVAEILAYIFQIRALRAHR